MSKLTTDSVFQLLNDGFNDNPFNLSVDNITNLQLFGNDIIIDVKIQNPTLSYKKKLEKFINEIILSQFSTCRIKLNFNLEASKNNVQIKGERIKGVKNIIAVSSGKGGVGKSTITSNLAVGLSEIGFKVGVVDADIYGPSMHLMLDLEGKIPKSINVDGINKIEPLENYGVKVLSIGFFAQSKQALVWRGPMATKALNQLIWDAHWGDLDYLLVDLPPGTGDIHLSLVQSIPVTGAIVISTPQPISVADARKGINMFQMDSINVPVVGLIENMSYFEDDSKIKYHIFGKDGGKILADNMNVNFLGEIPLTQSIRVASDIGRPAVLQGDTDIAKRFLNLCRKLVDFVEERNKKIKETESVKITHNKGCS